MRKTLKLSGKMRVIPMDREPEAEKVVERVRLTSNQIVNQIYEGGYSQDELRSISEAVRAMWKVDRADRILNAQCKLHNGQVVMLRDIRPRKLIGMTGQVENFYPSCKRANFRVTATNWNTGYAVGDLVRGIPLVCFEIIPEDVLKRAESNGG